MASISVIQCSVLWPRCTAPEGGGGGTGASGRFDEADVESGRKMSQMCPHIIRHEDLSPLLTCHSCPADELCGVL